jgi:hypothetical protein
MKPRRNLVGAGQESRRDRECKLALTLGRAPSAVARMVKISIVGVSAS